MLSFTPESVRVCTQGGSEVALERFTGSPGKCMSHKTLACLCGTTTCASAGQRRVRPLWGTLDPVACFPSARLIHRSGFGDTSGSLTTSPCPCVQENHADLSRLLVNGPPFPNVPPQATSIPNKALSVNASFPRNSRSLAPPGPCPPSIAW